MFKENKRANFYKPSEETQETRIFNFNLKAKFRYNSPYLLGTSSCHYVLKLLSNPSIRAPSPQPYFPSPVSPHLPTYVSEMK